MMTDDRPPLGGFELTGPLETERLLLRPVVASDLDAVFAYQSRPDVARYLYWGPRTRDEVRAALELKVAARSIHERGDVLALGVTVPPSTWLIGDLILELTSVEHRQAEIGYIIHPDHAGHGYATEAGREVLKIAFEDLRVHRVVGRLEARNTASARVLEKLGMRREAHLIENEFVKGGWQSEAIYAILDREWGAMQRA
jgi:RimJ/RimL family protein N-acetyltransferase